MYCLDFARRIELPLKYHPFASKQIEKPECDRNPQQLIEMLIHIKGTQIYVDVMAWTRSATTYLTARHPAAGVHLLTMLLRILRILLVFSSISCFATKVGDSVHYLITFERAENGLEGGQLLEDNEKAFRDDSSLRISTQNNENYICKIPAAPEEVVGFFLKFH